MFRRKCKKPGDDEADKKGNSEGDSAKIKVKNKSIFDCDSEEIKSSLEESQISSDDANSMSDCLEFGGGQNLVLSESDSESSLEGCLHKSSSLSLLVKDDKFDCKDNSDVKADDNLSATREDCTETSVCDYFDFTNIIKTQEMLRDISDRKSKEFDVQQSLVPSPFPKSKISSKSVIDTLNVSELLAIGESSNSNNLHCTTSVETEEDVNDVKHSIPTEGVEITIELPALVAKKKKKRVDLEAALKRQLNAVRKANQVYLHKVHLLCLIAHGVYINSLLNNDELLCTALSLVPSEKFFPPKQADILYLEQLVSWFAKKVKVCPGPPYNSNKLECLIKQFENKEANSVKDLVLMFICTVRVLGLKCRLMMSLQPLPLKPSVNETNLVEGQGVCTIPSSCIKDVPTVEERKVKTLKREKPKTDTKSAVKRLRKNSKESDNSSSNYFVPSNSSSSRESTKRKKSTDLNKKTRKQSSATNLKTEPPMKELKQKAQTYRTKGEKQTSESQSLEKSDKNIASLITAHKPHDKVKKEKTDFWAEVYLEAEEKWICVDVQKAKVHCVQDIYNSCTHPLLYVVGFNNDQTIKDLTRRYAPQWMTVTRKSRIDESWWNESLLPWKPAQTPQEKEEDFDLDKILQDKPLPTSITEYKNHPLYALKRHLLKFEAIYPPDAPTIGFIKHEPIYSRLCVSELHSRETWMRQAKLVRRNEKPYKIVRARPKYDKLTGAVIKNLDLELFGYWQVDDYIPPPAVDGKVPRNEYGNVELYKPCMLPSGTVHLQVPGLNRVARKLDIDCAPAVVGWEFHSGGSHPILDGFIVCEEFKDVLLDAWNKDIDEAARKNREKVKQRAYNNWKRLIRGLQIRDRLENRYKFGVVAAKVDKKNKSSKPKKS